MKKNFNLKSFLVENKLTEASRGRQKRVHFGEVELSDKVRLLNEVEKPLEELSWQAELAAAERASRLSQDTTLSPGRRKIKADQSYNLYPTVARIISKYGLNMDNLAAKGFGKTDVMNYLSDKKGDNVSATSLEKLSRLELKKLDRAREDYLAYMEGRTSYNKDTHRWENSPESAFNGTFEECDGLERPLEEAGYVSDDDFEDLDDIPYDARAAKAAKGDIAADSIDDEEEESFDEPEDLDDEEEDSDEQPETTNAAVSESDLTHYNPETVAWDPDFNLQEYVAQWPQDKWGIIMRVLDKGLGRAQKEANENGWIKRGLYMFRCSRTDSYKQGSYNKSDYETSVTDPRGRGDFIQMIAKVKPDPKAAKALGWD